MDRRELPRVAISGDPPEVASLRRRRRWILGFIALVLFTMAISGINDENDLWWQLKTGQDVVVRHTFHTTDVYSWTQRGATWTQHEWLAEVAFYLVQRWFSWPGLILFKALLVLATFAMVLWYLNRIKANLYLGILLVVVSAIVNTRGNWTVFPSLFEYGFIILAYLLLETYRIRRTRWVPWVLPVLALVWANTHGSFYLLDGMIVAYLLGDRIERWLRQRFPSYQPLAGSALTLGERRALLLSLGACLLTPLLSPNGFGLYAYPFRISFSPFSRAYVNEYQSFSRYLRFHYPSIGIVVALWSITVASMAAARRRANISDALLFLGFSYLGFRAYRHVAIFALANLPILAKYLTLWIKEYRGVFRRTLLKDAVAVFVILAFLLYYKTEVNPLTLRYSEAGYPRAAAQFLETERPVGPLFNHYNYGGYLIGNLPDYPVFIDGRLEMYLDPEFGDFYAEISEGGPQWSNLLNRYGVNVLLLSSDMPLVPLVLGNATWKLVYWDASYLVFVRDLPQNRVVIAKYHDRVAAEYQRYSYYSSNADAVAYEAAALRALKRWKLEEATELISRSLLADPNSVRARYVFGLVYAAQGLRDSARLQFERVLAESPGFQPARDALASL